MEYFLSNQYRRMSLLSVIAALQPEQVSPEKTKEGKEYVPSSRQTLQPLSMVNPEEAQDMKTQNTGLRYMRCISKE